MVRKATHHANNLRDSGVEQVIVGLRAGSGSRIKAENAGFRVAEAAEAAADADVVMMLTPDELQPALYREHIETQPQGRRRARPSPTGSTSTLN